MSGQPAAPRRALLIGFVAPFVVLAGLALAVVAAAWLGGRQPEPGAQIGMAAPDIRLADLDGNPVLLAELRGRPVIVNFWASWCAPCLDEFPLLTAALDRHTPDGLALIGVVFRDRSEAAREFMERMGASWPAVVDPGEDVARRYAILGPPETFFVDADGIVRGHQIGPLTAADLERQLARILPGTE